MKTFKPNNFASLLHPLCRMTHGLFQSRKPLLPLTDTPKTSNRTNITTTIKEQMSTWFQNLLIQLKLWRIMGIVSSVIGLLFYALSLSLKHVAEHWNRWSILKVSLYGTVSFSILFVMLFARKWRFTRSSGLSKAHMGVMAVMLTSLYSFFGDKDKGLDKPDAFSLVSNASFALMSLCLSKQIDLGFEAELLSFYLGGLILQLMNINFAFALVGAAFGYLLNLLRSCSDLIETETASHVELVAIEIDAVKREGTEAEAETERIRQLYSKLGIEIIKGEIVETISYPQDLEAKLVEAMAEEGFDKEHCFQVFIGWRRQFMEEKLLKDLMMSNIEEVHKMPLKYLKDEIERWVKASNYAFRTLFPNERLLCDRVFFGLSPLSDFSFVEICHEPTVHLLNFANAVANTTRSPERLFRILRVFETLTELKPALEVFETLTELKPALESMFSGDEWVMWIEAITILKRLKEAIRLVFMEMENLIRQDPARVAVSGGGLHPTNRYVMNFLCATCEFWETLELAFEKDEGSPSNSSSSCSSLCLQVVQILELLESNLKANSKVYKDSSLCSIFMMNNWRYIVHKVKKCHLGNVLGDEWIQKHITKMRQYLVNYQRSSWDQVLGMLNIVDTNNESSLALDVAYWEEKLELVKKQFVEIGEMQATWIVLDDQLREVMKNSLKKILLPAFENFITRFQNALEPREGVDTHRDFGVQDVVALIDNLFQGKDEHGNPSRINQPTWTVVLPSTHDFHEWRKFGEKTILDSENPRSLLLVILQNPCPAPVITFSTPQIKGDMVPKVPIPSLLKKPQLWRFMAFVSSAIGLTCYALSSPFKHIFGEWNFLKILLYGVGSFIMCIMVLYAKKWQLSRSIMLKAHMGVFVLMLTSVYSFFYDADVKGKSDILGLVSCVAFVMMLFSLSTQNTDMGFEVDLLNFFLGFLTIQLMKINFVLALVGGFFGYLIIVLRSSLDCELHIGTSAATATDHVAIEIIDAANRLQKVAEHDSNSGIQYEDRIDGLQSQSLRRRRAEDGNANEAPPRIQAEVRAESARKRMADARRIAAAMKSQHAFENYETRKMNAAAIRIQRRLRANFPGVPP